MKELVSSEQAYTAACNEFQAVAAAVVAQGGKSLQGGKTIQFPRSDEAIVHLFCHMPNPKLELPMRWEAQTDGRVPMSDRDNLILILGALDETPEVLRSSGRPYELTEPIESKPMAIEALTIITQGLRKHI